MCFSAHITVPNWSTHAHGCFQQTSERDCILSKSNKWSLKYHRPGILSICMKISLKKKMNVSNKTVREKWFNKNSSRCWKADSKLHPGVSETLLWGKKATIFQEISPEISHRPDLASKLQRLDMHCPCGLLTHTSGERVWGFLWPQFHT